MNKLSSFVIGKMKSTALSSSDIPEGGEQAIENYCNDILPSILESYGPDDEPAINAAFLDYTDSLCKDGKISEECYNSLTFDFEGWND